MSLRKNFSWTLVGNIIYAGCQWGMLVLIAKIGTPEMLGQFALGIAITAPVVMFCNLQLRTVLATDSTESYHFNDYLGLRLLMTLLAFLFIILITILAGYGRETALVILAVGLAKVIEAVSDIFHGLFQHHERMDRIAVSMMIKGPFSLLALGLGIFLTGSIFYGTLGLALSWALVLITYDLTIAVSLLEIPLQGYKQGFKGKVSLLLPRLQFKTLGKLVWLTIPLGAVAMLWSLNANIPRYFISHYLGLRELGIFSALIYLMVAETTVVSAMVQSAVPKMAQYWSIKNIPAFRALLFKLVGFIVMLGGVGVLVAWIAGQGILTILYRPEYGEHHKLLVWVLVVAALAGLMTVLDHYLIVLRLYRLQFILFAQLTFTIFLICLWRIPHHGLYGAILADGVSRIIFIAIVIVILSKMITPSNTHKRCN